MNCLITAVSRLSMVDESPMSIAEALGAKGDDLWWKEKKRGYHIQEVAHWLFTYHSIVLRQHVINPALAPFNEPEKARPLYTTVLDKVEAFVKVAYGCEGIMILPDHAKYFDWRSENCATSFNVNELIEVWIPYKVIT